MATTTGVMERKESNPSGEFFESVDHAATHATYLEDSTAALSEEHRQYLLSRHGTLDLDPLPSPSDADPYNWSNRKVCSKSIYSLDSPLIKYTESHKPCPCCNSCMYVDIYSRSYYSRLRKHCRRFRRFSSTSHISNIAANCHFRRCSPIVETIIQYFWKKTSVPHITHR